MPNTNYSGKVAVVTGGASGIGAAIGRALAQAGAEVVLADRQVELAEQVSAGIRREGGRATAEELDVRSLSSMTHVVEKTVARSGGVDYFFNNAGIGVGGEADTYEARDWDDVIDVNLRGVTNGVQAVYPVMIRRRTGHIVNTASVAGLLPTPGQASYTATKHAVVGLSKSLRVEAKRHGVRVSVLCPGVIRTPILMGGKFGRTNAVGLTPENMRAMWERLRPMDADVFAQKVLRAVARNEGIIVIPRWWRAFWYIDRLSPALSMKLSESLLDRARTQLERAGIRMVRGAEASPRNGSGTHVAAPREP
jgi:NAD(P)-dependent dehydrogenase (short-subunit alcohol dehydrogenase family)